MRTFTPYAIALAKFIPGHWQSSLVPISADRINIRVIPSSILECLDSKDPNITKF